MTSLTRGKSVLTNAIVMNVCSMVLVGPIAAGIFDDLIHPELAPDHWDNVHVSGYIHGHYMNHDGVPRLVAASTPNSRLRNLGAGFAQLRELSFFIDVSLHDSVTLSTEVEFFTNARLRFECQRSAINNFDAAPPPYIDAGGERVNEMLMLSAIYSF